MDARVRDAETYLREAGEQLVLGGARHPFALERLLEVAEILEVAGALDGEVAAGVLSEYVTALRLRGGHVPLWRAQTGAPAAVPIPPARSVTGPWEVGAGAASIVVERVRFAADGFALEAHGSLAPGQLAGGRFGMGHRSPIPGSLAVVDAAGTAAVATSAGGGWGSHSWESKFSSSTPLDPATPWVEVAGQRIDIPPGRQTGTEAWVEDVPVGEDAVVAVLWHSLASNALDRHRIDPGRLEDAVEALVATGSRRFDDPAIEDVRRVWAAIHGTGGQRAALPPRWSAWQRRRARTDGPVGQLSLAAGLEDVDGCNLRLDALESRADGFSLQLAASPGAVILNHPGARRQLVFWAEDDRGNVYLGGSGNNGGSDRMAEGQVEFTGPIDPAARLLRLLPTGRHRRGVVDVPLGGLTAGR